MTEQTDISPKQRAVLSAIYELDRELGKMPTLDELRIKLGYKGVSSVQRHVDTLKAKGFLEGDKYQTRSLRRAHQHTANIPLVGNVACGTPLLAEENIEAYIPYEESKLKGSPENYFFLRANGDSMNNAGINDGDFILVRKESSADPGKNVVVLIGDEATVKKLTQEDGLWVLKPESTNTSHKKLIMLDDFTIQGVVEGVISEG